MKRVLLLLSSTIVLASACNYAKPSLYLTVSNHSGQKLQNLELDYPGGTFGLPMLANDQTHRRLAQRSEGICKFTLRFDATDGRKHSKDFTLGETCPKEVGFEVGPDLDVTEHKIQP